MDRITDDADVDVRIGGDESPRLWWTLWGVTDYHGPGLGRLWEQIGSCDDLDAAKIAALVSSTSSYQWVVVVRHGSQVAEVVELVFRRRGRPLDPEMRRPGIILPRIWAEAVCSVFIADDVNTVLYRPAFITTATNGDPCDE